MSWPKKIFFLIGTPVWVLLGFMLAQALVIGAIYGLGELGFSSVGVDDTVLSTVYSAIVYLLSIAIVIGVPYLAHRRRTSLKLLGLQRLPEWMDFLWAPAGYITYAILSTLALSLASEYLPFVDIDQSQETGFENLSQQYEFILAFVSLVVVTPIAEEILFRGYLLGKLRKRFATWLAVLVTSLLFGIAHFAWNVGIDVFVLSIVLSVLRIVTGSLWAPIVLHMIKNGIAYYFLFINTSILLQ